MNAIRDVVAVAVIGASVKYVFDNYFIPAVKKMLITTSKDVAHYFHYFNKWSLKGHRKKTRTCDDGDCIDNL